ncbi:hypothetical protein BAE44_0004248 [Dichanthelium oligosanthes]|uniref:Uncharacterized protein n=1 Tax=Dichanthelium oligosanthes TaxID=888268 RepID=A0A1E5WBY6_9POAL|nr:hypothetical protein BAE44_0004248 [Dichanthelium oligosanthes]
MPKRRREERGGVRAAKRRQRRHLYLLFDDWPAGYSIRKVDLPSDEVDPDDPYGRQTPARVPGKGEMPVARETALASVLEHHVPVFNVLVRSCLFGPRSDPEPSDPIYIPAGGRLFARAAGTFDLLYPPPPLQPLDSPAYGEGPRAWSWVELPDPPFKRKRVASYAVHPDGQTIFVSTTKRASAATFAFDTAERGAREWKAASFAAQSASPEEVPLPSTCFMRLK